MCGIFGMVRNIEAPHYERASAALIELGRLAVERGKDSSGLAFIPRPDQAPATVYLADAFQMKARSADLDGVIIVKDTLPFGEFWDDAKYLSALTSSAAVIGHTRWATQGSKSKLENASPLAVGYVVGTHNGDVDVDSVQSHATHRKDIVGGTDTEYLYRAVASKNSHRKKITDILKGLKGRAALAWIDRTVTDRLYLARAALSPLSIAFDAEGNMYWASNPDWFRQIDAKFDNAIGFHSISLVNEGSLITVNFSSGKPEVEDLRKFTPTARYTDDMMSDAVVWRGFVKEDSEADKAGANHLVTEAKRWTYSSSSVKSSVGTSSRGSEDRWGDYAAEFSASENYNPASGSYVSGQGSFEDSLYADEAYAIPDELSDEIQDAVITWAEQGYNPLVVTSVQAALSDADFARVAKDYALSGVEAARLFKREVLLWNEHGEIEPANIDTNGNLDQQVALAESVTV